MIAVRLLTNKRNTKIIYIFPTYEQYLRARINRNRNNTMQKTCRLKKQSRMNSFPEIISSVIK